MGYRVLYSYINDNGKLNKNQAYKWNLFLILIILCVGICKLSSFGCMHEHEWLMDKRTKTTKLHGTCVVRTYLRIISYHFAHALLNFFLPFSPNSFPIFALRFSQRINQEKVKFSSSTIFIISMSFCIKIFMAKREKVALLTGILICTKQDYRIRDMINYYI